MTQTRISRTLATTGVTAALLCALLAVGAAGSCDTLRDGQDFIDWARSRSNRNHLALGDRQVQSLRTLLDDPRDGQSFIDWARAQSNAK